LRTAAFATKAPQQVSRNFIFPSKERPDCRAISALPSGPARNRERRQLARVGRDVTSPEDTSKGREMKLLNLFKTFKSDESGAVTVDWVVLTAAIVGLGMVVMVTVGGGITGLGNAIVTDLGTRSSGYENQ
jgi:Flp pilus assembly pilin Flp